MRTLLLKKSVNASKRSAVVKREQRGKEGQKKQRRRVNGSGGRECWETDRGNERDVKAKRVSKLETDKAEDRKRHSRL